MTIILDIIKIIRKFNCVCFVEEKCSQYEKAIEIFRLSQQICSDRTLNQDNIKVSNNKLL